MKGARIWVSPECAKEGVAGQLYTSKMPITAAQMMNNDVLAFYEEQDVTVKSVLSDNGREFCGRPDTHPYELLLQLNDIEHKRPRVGRPQSNGIVERFHRTLLDEHLRVKGRTKWYERLDEMQTDLDAYLLHYNRERPHQGYNMQGKTPWQVFEAERKKLQKPKTKPRKEPADTAG